MRVGRVGRMPFAVDDDDGDLALALGERVAAWVALPIFSTAFSPAATDASAASGLPIANCASACNANSICWTALVHIFRHEPSAVAEYAGRALRICEEHRIAQLHAYALCADGWALAASGESEKGLAQIVQGVHHHGIGVLQHMLLALQADAQLATGKPEAALASVAAGLEAVEKMGGAPLEAELHRLKGEALLAGALSRETRAGACAISAGLRAFRSEHAFPGLAGCSSRRAMPALADADLLDARLPGSVPR